MDTLDSRSKRIEELTEKVELNELRARDAQARCKIVEAELKLMQLRESMDKTTGESPQNVSEPEPVQQLHQQPTAVAS